MKPEDIRQLVIAALFGDEVLFQHLVLKGGNALELVHRVVSRGSVDVDLSISGQFDDIEDIRRRIFQTLSSSFMKHGLAVFDEEFEVVPPIRGTDPLPWWGGYVVRFKLIERAKQDAVGASHRKLQIQAIPVDLTEGRVFKIEISKHEYCKNKVQSDITGQTIYVYSEEMCVLEKLRAICQQMPEYCVALGSHPTPRGRDFYDIYATISRRAIDLSLPENLELCRAIFEAKRVPLGLIPKIISTREFHRPDWDAVRDTVQGEVFDFEFYFDYVITESNKLKALWVE